MKIAIEAQRIFRKKKHGMDIVILECIRELQNIDTQNDYYILVAPDEDRCLTETKNFHIIEINCRFFPLWEQVALPLALNKIKPDLVHCTSDTAPRFCKYPLILTLHDIIFLEPQSEKSTSLYQRMGRIYRRFIIPRIVPRCSKIITVSNFECKHICESLHLSEDKVLSIYNGYSQQFKVSKDFHITTKKYIEEDNYILFLGNTDPKKNAPRTLTAYNEYLKQVDKKRKLLIIDLSQSYIDNIVDQLHIEEIKNYIVCPGYVSNVEMSALYNGAYFFLYTSLRESFGIPILESMACGTPVITGNSSAMPEIAGDGGCLVDTTSAEDICNKMLQLECNSNYYKQQVEYGLERVKLFSWKHTAENMLKLYTAFSPK